MTVQASHVLVLGEALVDAVVKGGVVVAEHVGGSPANVAFGLGALGHGVSLATWIGLDARGERIAQRCADAGVRVVDGSTGAEETSVAYATIDARGQANYRFDLTWALPELGDTSNVGHVHTGSISATLEPGGAQVVDAVRALRKHSTVSYDPNMRPTLMGSADAVRARVEELISLSDVVKASDEDVQWLYPGAFLPDVLREWEALGPALAVITRGGQGAVYAVSSATGESAREVTTVPSRATTVIDTVGAGDSFMAGLISGLLDAGYLGGPKARARLSHATIDDLRPCIDRALATSGVTVGHAGAYAPTHDELDR
ncbi:MAG: PfkB family carbohydrate kinase [Candidatus Phosphoribacter sp.]|nr:carbohydrate kinase [Actinomycetales bacterium]